MVMRKVQEYHLLKHSTEARKNWAQEQLGKKHSGSFMCLNSFLNNNKVKNNKLNMTDMPREALYRMVMRQQDELKLNNPAYN